VDLFYFELTVIVCLAAFLAIVFRFLKQPPVLAYILAGVIIGPLGIYKIHGGELMESLAQVGITLLLFMLGLELRFSELKSVGKISLVTGIGQIIFTTVFGFIICTLLGFAPVAALYISIALTFSSTIIIVKLLSDKRDLNSLYGKISVGFLLVQDFVAILALILLSGFTKGGEISPFDFILVIAKSIALFGLVILISKKLLPFLLNKISHSAEIMFLFSLAWAFGVAALVSSPLIGFSIEIGGFLAGLALANSYESFQITSRIKPLRDFFITIFFVTLGMGLLISDFSTILIPGIILSLFVLIGNPIIVMILMGLLGYRKRTGFMAGLTVAQISEFSLIVMFMGNRIGHISDENIALITFVGAVTFVTSTYMILNSNTLYKHLEKYLNIFERKNAREKNIKLNEHKDHIILVGGKRMGESILNALINNKQDFVVLDFDPDVIDKLKERGIECYFGDIADPEIQELVNIDKAKLIISTVSDFDDNLALLHYLNKLKSKPKIVMQSLEKDEAKELYKFGADYVVLPHVAGGHHLAKILVDEKHMELIEEYKKKDLDQFNS
jgi:Kef-type K+ transport system membrane component KefB